MIWFGRDDNMFISKGVIGGVVSAFVYLYFMCNILVIESFLKRKFDVFKGLCKEIVDKIFYYLIFNFIIFIFKRIDDSEECLLF